MFMRLEFTNVQKKENRLVVKKKNTRVYREPGVHQAFVSYFWTEHRAADRTMSCTPGRMGVAASSALVHVSDLCRCPRNFLYFKTIDGQFLNDAHNREFHKLTLTCVNLSSAVNRKKERRRIGDATKYRS